MAWLQTKPKALCFSAQADLVSAPLNLSPCGTWALPRRENRSASSGICSKGRGKRRPISPFGGLVPSPPASSKPCTCKTHFHTQCPAQPLCCPTWCCAAATLLPNNAWPRTAGQHARRVTAVSKVSGQLLWQKGLASLPATAASHLLVAQRIPDHLLSPEPGRSFAAFAFASPIIPGLTSPTDWEQIALLAQK